MLELKSNEKPLHILAIFFFALTQLCAPLVHAHVDGMQDDSSFHSHGIPSPIDLSQCHVEADESQAFSIPHQNLGNDTLVIPGFLASFTHPLPPGVTRASAEPYNALRSAEHPYHKPHTQAPPLRG